MGEGILSVKTNEVNIEQIAKQIEISINSLRCIRSELEKYLNSEIEETFLEDCHHYLSVLPKRTKDSIISFFQGILKQGLTENDLERLDFLVDEFVKFQEDIEQNDNSVIILFDKLIGQIDRNNIDGQLFVKKLQELSNSGQLAMISCGRKEYYSPDLNFISINFPKIKNGNIGVMAHEIGHLLHFHMGAMIPENFDSIVNDAGKQALENGQLRVVLDQYKKIKDDAYIQAKKETSITVKEKIKGLASLIIPETFAQKLANLEKNHERIYEIVSNKSEFSPRLADIIDAVYKETQLGVDGDLHWLTAQHGYEYYSKVSPFVEMIADFTALKVTSNEHDLQLLRGMFGKDFYDMLDTTFQKLIQPTLIQEQESALNEVIEWAIPQDKEQREKQQTGEYNNQQDSNVVINTNEDVSSTLEARKLDNQVISQEKTR